MGHMSRPNKVQGWEGIFPGQTTYNGGGSRVPLDWSPGMPIDFTRKTIPIETVRIASLCSQYKEWVESFDASDSFLRKCVNNGVPLRTACAVLDAVHAVLVRAGVPHDITPDAPPSADAVCTSSTSP